MHYDGEQLVSDDDDDIEDIEGKLRLLADSDLPIAGTAEQLLGLVG